MSQLINFTSPLPGFLWIRIVFDDDDNNNRRGYGFANHITGYNLPLEGQEGFSVIKYGSTDEYRPHCDGDCTGAPYKLGGRVATMVSGWVYDEGHGCHLEVLRGFGGRDGRGTRLGALVFPL